VRPTRVRLLVGIAVVVGVLTWGLLRILDAWRGGYPDLRWITPVTVLLLAVAVLATVLAVRPRLRRDPGTKPVPPLLAARFAALSLACSRAGAAIAGGYAGFAVALVGQLDTAYGRERAIYAVLTVVASVLLIVFALMLEHACRIPDDTEGTGGNGSTAAA
jgi:hypothetical protein